VDNPVSLSATICDHFAALAKTVVASQQAAGRSSIAQWKNPAKITRRAFPQLHKKY